MGQEEAYDGARDAHQSYDLAISELKKKYDAIHKVEIGNCVLYNAPCEEVMPLLERVEAIVTDPPYGLSFMGKAWDYDVPKKETWELAFKLLNPGGHLLSFFGSRTYHRGAVQIEDAGFEIRDQIMWIYGSGFPKSLNVSKVLEKQGKKEEARKWQGFGSALKPAFEPLCVAQKKLDDKFEEHLIKNKLSILEAQLWLMFHANVAPKYSECSQKELSAACDIAQWSAEDATNIKENLSDLMDTSQYCMKVNTCLSIVSSWLSTWEEILKRGSTSTTKTKLSTTIDLKTLKFCLSQITPITIVQGLTIQNGENVFVSNAEKYFNAELKRLNAILELFALENVISLDLQGSLDVDEKVKHNPLCLARKPLNGTVAENVLNYNCGALNIDGCRVFAEENDYNHPGNLNKTLMAKNTFAAAKQKDYKVTQAPPNSLGRWPANIIHDGSDGVVELFPSPHGAGHSNYKKPREAYEASNYEISGGELFRYGDSGSAARFFYCAKASKADRDEGLEDLTAQNIVTFQTGNGASGKPSSISEGRNTEYRNIHPTVKPTTLMRNLCRLVTPPNGTVLDPFMGSGSTGKAAVLEGFRFIGIEMNKEYFDIAVRRIKAAYESRNKDLFNS